MKPKNVCFLIGNLNYSGGTERVTSLIANELNKLNYNISILSLNNGDEPFFDLDIGIQAYSLYPQKISFKKNIIGVIGKIRRFVKEHNIDTLVVVDSIGCVFTVPALYGLNINHICWEHFNFNVNLGVKLRDLGRRLAARYCDYIVTLTSRDEELWKQGIKSMRSKTITIGNPSPYESINHVPKLEYKTILAVGRLTFQKGFDLLIESWSKVCKENNSWLLRIIGNGEDEYLLKEQASLLGISDRIEFISVTNEIEKYYQTSSFFCLSSRFEGFGMVIVEAQSFSLPVISFNCDCGPRDLIEDGINGFLVKNGSTNALANTILMSISLDEPHYKKFSDNAKILSSQFSIDSVLQIWKTIL